MRHSSAAPAGPSTDLLERYESLHRTEPTLRLRDAADRLGVSEAELIAARCGRGVIRLNSTWPSLIEGLGTLGTVMALTRNDHAVHEKVGRYERISVSAAQGRALITGPDIDLRIRLGHWRFAYAVTEDSGGSNRSSLQFFDGDGTAVHKVFLREGSNRDAYIGLVARHTAPDQSAGEHVDARLPPRASRPDAGIDVEALRARWLALQDVHDFANLLRETGTDRTQAFRLIGAEFAERVEPSSFVAAIERAAASALPLMVFVPSRGVVQIHTGPVKTLKRVGAWFNVLDPHFNLHLRDDNVVSAWLVRKPTRDGLITSLEIYDSAARQIAWMFGQRERNAPEREDWRRLTADLPRLGTGTR